MPTYDYRCETCGLFAALRRIADRDASCACPSCGRFAQRTLSVPALSLMGATRRAGHQLNERSAHAPQHSSAYTHRHGPGCGCGSAAQTKPASSPGALKGNGGGRPWMISH